MKRIESSVKHIPYSQEQVYTKVSDLSNLRSLVDRIPEDQKKNINLENLECTADKVSTTVSPIGTVELLVCRSPRPVQMCQDGDTALTHCAHFLDSDSIHRRIRL